MPRGAAAMRSSSLVATSIAVVLATSAATARAGTYRREELAVDGVTRELYVYTPDTLGPGPSPVVLAFHGFLSDASGLRWITKMDKFADAAGFVVIYPNAVEKSWNAGRGSGSKNRTTDDLAFARELLAATAARPEVDPTRIYAMGFSNGAQMVATIVCKLENPLAAAVMVAHSLNIPDCQPRTRVPMLLIQGRKDPFVPFEGGGQSQLASHAFTVDAFRKFNGAESPPRKVVDLASITCTQSDDRAGLEQVLECTGANDGHTWPGGVSFQPELFGPTNSELLASELMFAFFARHPQPAPPRSLPAGAPAGAPGRPRAERGARVAAPVPACTAAPAPVRTAKAAAGSARPGGGAGRPGQAATTSGQAAPTGPRRAGATVAGSGAAPSVASKPALSVASTAPAPLGKAASAVASKPARSAASKAPALLGKAAAAVASKPAISVASKPATSASGKPASATPGKAAPSLAGSSASVRPGKSPLALASQPPALPAKPTAPLADKPLPPAAPAPEASRWREHAITLASGARRRYFEPIQALTGARVLVLVFPDGAFEPDAVDKALGLGRAPAGLTFVLLHPDLLEAVNPIVEQVRERAGAPLTVAAVGIGGGGGAVQRLFCERSDLVSAVVMIAAAFKGPACQPMPVPALLSVQSTRDGRAPAEGDPKRGLLGQAELRGAWRFYLGQMPDPDVKTGPGYVCAGGRPPRGSPEVRTCRIESGEQGVPVGSPPGSFDAPKVVADFLLRHVDSPEPFTIIHPR